jgi:hypothetical protein
MDYRFAIRCWQDQAGDENAKANVFVDGVQVATEVEITATSADSPGLITWESTGLTAPAADTSFDIKVVLTNEYYVDADTDRNIRINGIGYLTKAADGNYKVTISTLNDDPAIAAVHTENTITDFTDYANYAGSVVPTAVTGDQIADGWWASRDEDAFYIVVVWGGSVTGVTMTTPIVHGTCTA